MRQETITLYKFDELSKEAREKAIESLTEILAQSADEGDNSEYEDALQEIEKAFGIKVTNYCVGSYRLYDFNFKFTDSRWKNWDWDDITEKNDPSLLLRYFNEVDNYCRKGKYYSIDYYKDGKYSYKRRYSKVIFPEYSCMLTGTWCTNAVDDVMNNFWDYYRKGFSVREFINEMLDKFFSYWEEDLNYHWSREYIEEEIEAADFEFTENGERYC